MATEGFPSKAWSKAFSTPGGNQRNYNLAPVIQQAVEHQQPFTLFFQEVDGGSPRGPWMDISSNKTFVVYIMYQ